ncbi:MAG: DUF4388 domain-containing protein [candidate division KSB1 bacterium]|nr:DUF4388 domain-containing protein [candidate division KSB1 bacterium]
MPDSTTKILAVEIPAELAQQLQRRAQRLGLPYREGDFHEGLDQVPPRGIVLAFLASPLSATRLEQIERWARRGLLVMVVHRNLNLEERLQLYRAGICELVDQTVGAHEIGVRVARLARLACQWETGPGRPASQGDLEETPLTDLLDRMRENRATAVLSLVSGERRGRVFVRQGEIVDVEVEGLPPLDALLQVCLWARGTYTVEERDFQRPGRLGREATQVLARAQRLRKLMGAARQELPPPDAPLVSLASAEDLAELSPEERRLLTSLEGTKTLLDLLRDSEREPELIVELVRGLRASGLIGEVQQESRGAETAMASAERVHNLLPRLFLPPRNGQEKHGKELRPLQYRPGLSYIELEQLRRALARKFLSQPGESALARKGEEGAFPMSRNRGQTE